MTLELRTLGLATLSVLEDGIPLVATDPWLIGSTYWQVLPPHLVPEIFGRRRATAPENVMCVA